MRWKAYFEQTKDKPESVYLRKAVKLLEIAPGMTALDLGSGAGRDSRYLSRSGFVVTAVDGDEMAREYVDTLPNVKFVQARFSDFTFEQYDLINASYAIPFAGRGEFDRVWSRLLQSLKPGGMFAGELFGVKDDWNNDDGRLVFHALADVKHLLGDLRVVDLVEEEYDRSTASGDQKHWHVFHIVALKPR